MTGNTTSSTCAPDLPTDRQRAVLEFLQAHQERVGRTPTGPEISRHFGFRDASSSYQHLRLLEQKGYLEITRAGRRTPLGVRLTALARNLLGATYPLFGSVPAGPLEDVVTHADQGVLSVEDLIPELRKGDYFLTVDGDSMVDAGLQPGDLVVIRPEQQARSGDICAVWVEGYGNTLKRVRFAGDQVVLEPANPRHQARTFAADMVRIQGHLVASLSIRHHPR